jgi:hypothetical protein
MQKNNALYLIFFLFSFIPVNGVLAQDSLQCTFIRSSSQPSVKLEDYAVCPLVNVTYRIKNYSPSCHTLTLTNGTIITPINSSGDVVIRWVDSTNCRINITRSDSIGCTGGTSPAAPPREFKPIVLSLASTIPAIEQTPPGPLSVGYKIDLLYTGKAKYPTIGSLDTGDVFLLDEYQWTYPSAWTLVSTVPTWDTIRLKTDLATGGKITARAYNKVCGIAGYSPVGELAINRIMPSPCPIVAASNPIELCGIPVQSKFDCMGLPPNFQIPSSGVTYEWSVTPSDGWTKIGELDNSVKYQTDGQKKRVVKVKVTSYGVSSECSYIVELFAAHPLTTVENTFTDKKLLCDTEKFSLDSPLPDILPPGSTVTWSVSSLNPDLPTPISPQSGTGLLAALSATGQGGSSSKIDFLVEGCGISTILSDTFFAGVPAIYDKRIDGVPGTQAFLCPGSHYASLKVSGADASCVTWANSGSNPHNFNCTSVDMYMTGYSGSSTFIAYATNECGTNDARFFLIPKQYGCQLWGLSIFPNPAVDVVTVESVITDGSPLEEAPEFEDVRLISGMGNLVFHSQQTTKSITIPLSGIAPGIYTLQATANGEQISEIVNIKPE